MAKIRGKDFRVTFLDTTQKTVLYAQEATYSSETTMLEANHKDNANTIEREPDTDDYSLTGTNLVAWDPGATEVNFEFLWNEKKARTAVVWEFQTSTGFVLAGTGFFSTLELTANDGEYVSDSWTLVANGPDKLTAI